MIQYLEGVKYEIPVPLTTEVLDVVLTDTFLEFAHMGMIGIAPLNEEDTAALFILYRWPMETAQSLVREVQLRRPGVSLMVINLSDGMLLDLQKEPVTVSVDTMPYTVRIQYTETAKSGKKRVMIESAPGLH
jgi:hypothetical protein